MDVSVLSGQPPSPYENRYYLLDSRHPDQPIKTMRANSYADALQAFIPESAKVFYHPSRAHPAGPNHEHLVDPLGQMNPTIVVQEPFQAIVGRLTWTLAGMETGLACFPHLDAKLQSLLVRLWGWPHD